MTTDNTTVRHLCEESELTSSSKLRLQYLDQTIDDAKTIILDDDSMSTQGK